MQLAAYNHQFSFDVNDRLHKITEQFFRKCMQLFPRDWIGSRYSLHRVHSILVPPGRLISRDSKTFPFPKNRFSAVSQIYEHSVTGSGKPIVARRWESLEWGVVMKHQLRRKREAITRQAAPAPSIDPGAATSCKLEAPA